MCPDPQILSIYLDGELPSPWKEKMEAHLAQCSVCKEKLDNFRRLFKNDVPELSGDALKERTLSEYVPAEQELIEAAKARVWQNLEEKRRFQRHNLWQRRLSIPLPAAAAAAVILAVLAVLWLRVGAVNQTPESAARAGFMLAAEEEIPGIPAADMNGVLQYLGSDGVDILILRLPESRNFLRSGEPEVIRPANYTGRRP